MTLNPPHHGRHGHEDDSLVGSHWHTALASLHLLLHRSLRHSRHHRRQQHGSQSQEHSSHSSIFGRGGHTYTISSVGRTPLPRRQQGSHVRLRKTMEMFSATAMWEGKYRQTSFFFFWENEIQSWSMMHQMWLGACTS
jgi:hypothetical protein